MAERAAREANARVAERQVDPALARVRRDEPVDGKPHLALVAGLEADEPAARALVTSFARALGLHPERLDVRIDDEGARENRQRGSHGLVRDGRVLLDPARFRTGTREGRLLLGHELAHVAQLRPHRPRGGQLTDGRSHEREARAIAELLADYRLPHAPRIELPSSAVALLDPQAPVDEAPVATESLDSLVAARYGEELERMRSLLRGFLGFLWVTDGDVAQILRILQTVPFAVARAMVRALDSEGGKRYRNSLLDNLSSSHNGRYRREVLAALSAMPDGLLAARDAGLFEGMDFTGLSDEEHWAIARLRRRRSGIPPSVWQTLSRAPGEQGQAVSRLISGEFGPAAFQEREAESEARDELSRRIQERRKDIERIAGLITDDPDLYNRIAELTELLREGPSDDERVEFLDRAVPLLREPEVMRAFVRHLEGDPQGDLMERLLDGFPVRRLYQGKGDEREQAADRRWGETRLGTLLRLLSHREPWKNLEFAERLLDTGFWTFDWSVSDEEAYFALQLIRVAPPRVRDSFFEAHGETLDENVSQRMRESPRWNFYRGGEGRLDQANIQARLLNESLWTLEGIPELRGFLRMAVTAGEHRFAFEQSRHFAQARPEVYFSRRFLDEIVEDNRLYNPNAVDAEGEPAPRQQYEARYADEIPWYREGAIGGFFHMLGEGLEVINTAGRFSFNADSVGGSGFNAVEFQDVFGGSFMGLRFESFERLGVAGERALAYRSGVNFIDRVNWNHERGILEMEARDLAIAALRYPVGSLVFQSGAGRVSGMDLRITYRTESVDQDTALNLEIASLVLNDFQIVAPDWMIGVNRVTVTGLFVRMGRDAITEGQPEAPPIVHSGLAWHLLPVLGASDTLQQSLLEPATPTAIDLSWDDLHLEGIARSNGDFIEELSIQDFNLRLSGTRAEYLAGLNASRRAIRRRRERLARRLPLVEDPGARDALNARLDRLDQQDRDVFALIERIREAEATVARLEARRRRALGTVSEGEEAELSRARDFLATFDDGGMTLSAGVLTLRGMRGGTSLEELELTDLQGTGTSGAGILAALTESTVLTRIIEGQAHRRPVVTSRDVDEATFTLDLGNIAVDDFRVAGSIPSVADAEVALAQARAQAHPLDPVLLRAQLDAERTLTNARRYHDLATIGISYLRPNERAEFLELRDGFLSEEALYAARVRIERGALTLGARAGQVGFSAARFEATRPEDEDGNPVPDAPGIRIGERTIGEIHGRDVHVGARLAGGLLGDGDLLERVQEAGLEGEQLEILDVRDPGQGLAVERLDLATFDLGIDVRGTGTVTADARLFRAEGVRRSITREELVDAVAVLEGQAPGERSAAENDQLETLNRAIDQYDAFNDAVAEALERYRAATGEERETAEQALRELLLRFIAWREQFGALQVEVADLGVRLTGLGNPFAEGFSFADALEGNLVIEGTGASASQLDARGQPRRDRLFSRASLTDTRLGAGEVATVTAGETAGRIRRDEAGLHVDDIAIESLEVSGLRLRSVAPARGGGLTVSEVFAEGSSTARGISATASLGFREDPETGARSLARVQLHALRIEEITGQGVGYRSAARDDRPDPLREERDAPFTPSQEFRLDSGTIHGVHATNLIVDLPAGPEAALEINGHAGVESLSDVRVRAFIRGTLDEARARLSGDNVTVDFMADGTRVINVVGRPILDENGDVVGHEGLDVSGFVRAGANAAGFRAQDLRGRVRQRGDDIWLENIQLPTLHLDRLALRTASLDVTVPEGGGPLTLEGIQADAQVRLDSENDNRPFQRIAITRLRIATARARGFTVVKRGEPNEDGVRRDITITGDGETEITANDIRLEPLEEGDGAFVIEMDPTGNVTTEGNLHVSDASGSGVALSIDRLDTTRAGAELENLLNVSTTDFELESLDVGMLTDGNITLDLARLRLTELLAESGNHAFSISSQLATLSDSAALDLNGLRMAADGTTTIDSVNVTGFRYERAEWGLTIEVESGRLPERITVHPSEPFEVPELVIDDAHFHIADVGALPRGAPATDPNAAPSGVVPTLIDHVSGTASFDLFAGPVADNVSITITNGVVNLDDIESDLALDNFVDFDLDEENRTLALNLDYGNVSIITGMIPAFNLELARFPRLPDEDIERARERNARIATLIDRFETDLMPAEAEEEDEQDEGEPMFGIRNIDVDLTLAPTPLDLGEYGGIVLGGDGNDGAVGISVTGDVPDRILIAIEQINAHLTDDHALRFNGVSVSGGSITVTGMEAALDFDGFTPTELTGNVSSAVARGLTVDLSDEEGSP